MCWINNSKPGSDSSVDLEDLISGLIQPQSKV